MARKSGRKRRDEDFVVDDTDSDSWSEEYVDEQPIEVDVVQYFAGRTKQELHEGKRRQAGPAFINKLVQHALSNGYSAKVRPSLAQLFSLFKAMGMPVSRKDASLNSKCINIVVNAIQTHLKEKEWLGHLLERSDVETGACCLYISAALFDQLVEKKNRFSKKSILGPNWLDLKQAQASNGDRWRKGLRSVSEDDMGWTALRNQAVSRLKLFPKYLDSPDIHNDMAIVGAAQPPYEDVWSAPMFLDHYAQTIFQQKYYSLIVGFMKMLLNDLQYEEDRESQYLIKLQLAKCKHDNNNSVHFQEDVNYEMLYMDRRASGLIEEVEE